MIKIDITVQLKPQKVVGDSWNQGNTVDEKRENHFGGNQSAVSPYQRQICRKADKNEKHGSIVIEAIKLKSKPR